MNMGGEKREEDIVRVSDRDREKKRHTEREERVRGREKKQRDINVSNYKLVCKKRNDANKEKAPKICFRGKCAINNGYNVKGTNGGEKRRSKKK